MKRYFYLVSSSLLFSSSVSAQIDITELSQSPYWLKLGHYLPTITDAYKSNVDSEEFFLSSEGKHSPRAELKATYEALYSNDSALSSSMRCAYPARYSWLEEQQGRKAQLDCPELTAWETTLDPDKLSLIFPTAYMNNPSSMFGHTLLRIDAKDKVRNKDLIAFAINFAAEPETTDNAALYAIKGMVGSYPGRFTVMPYYRKVRQYNDIESRDIWEYPLNFNPSEVHRILLHLWEMQRADFDYYFLDENCSYQLLALLQVGREQLDLVSEFDLVAIPSDTVKTLVEHQLIEEPVYRESFGTRLFDQYKQLTPNQFDAAVLAKQGTFPTPAQFTPKQRAAVLEFAYEWLNFELYDESLDRDETAKRLTQLLQARSQLKVSSPFTPTPTPQVSPEQGHGSSRIGAGYQISESSDNNALTLEWRASYHDLLDHQLGYIPGAKINFFDAQLNYNNDKNLTLDHLDLINAQALAPSNQIFDSLAWNIRLAYEHLGQENWERSFLKLGFGKAWGDASEWHYYHLVSGELSHGEFTNHNITAGIGLDNGIYYSVNDEHKLGVTSDLMFQTDGKEKQFWRTSFNWNWSLSNNTAIRSTINYEHIGESEWQYYVRAYHYY